MKTHTLIYTVCLLGSLILCAGCVPRSAAPTPAPPVPAAASVSTQEAIAPAPTSTQFPPPTYFTLPPVPTPLPTPVVTPVSEGKPPFIPIVVDTPQRPYTIIAKTGSVIHLSRSDDSTKRVLIDAYTQLSRFVAGTSVGVEKWGSASPDGKQLAVVLSNVESRMDLPKGEAPRLDLYIMDIHSGDTTLLAEYATSPAWSPDGEWIAYRNNQTQGLWIVNPTTRETREIYAVDYQNEHFVSEMSWSPDSQRIAFLDMIFRQSQALMVADIAGSIPPQQLVPASDRFIYSPQWAPDTEKILYVSTAGKSSSRTTYNLWVINSNGTDPLQLTQDIDIVASCPTWSPRGRWIVFAGIALYEKTEEMADLWLIDITEQNLQRLTTTPAYETLPVWTPDGNQVIYFKNESKEMWTMDLSNGTQRKMDVSLGNPEDFLVIP